uniref:Uncharacterized protein n=1 Tax=Kalanchoe fedtschenkoi TaxID=63787 RepID=A0A7N0U1H9_KALFE
MATAAPATCSSGLIQYNGLRPIKTKQTTGSFRVRSNVSMSASGLKYAEKLRQQHHQVFQLLNVKQII